MYVIWSRQKLTFISRRRFCPSSTVSQSSNFYKFSIRLKITVPETHHHHFHHPFPHTLGSTNSWTVYICIMNLQFTINLITSRKLLTEGYWFATAWAVSTPTLLNSCICSSHRDFKPLPSLSTLIEPAESAKAYQSRPCSFRWRLNKLREVNTGMIR
jgi:hypothetical protein